MQAVVITRHFSGFRNVADHLEVGDKSDVDAVATRYRLPAGYTVDVDPVMGRTIYDPAGWACEPALNGNVPFLYSRGGDCQPARLFEAA